MNLTDLEKKLLILAMDRSARDGEVEGAATKFFRSLRQRYPSGHELIKELMMSSPLSEMSDFMRRATQPQAQPQNTAWSDILRRAQEHGRNFAARQQDRYSAAEEAIKRESERRRREYEEWKRRQQAEYDRMMAEMGEQAQKTYATPEEAIAAANEADKKRKWRRF